MHSLVKSLTFFFFSQFLYCRYNNQCYNNLYFADFFLVYQFCSVILSSFLMRKRRSVWIGLGRETFENVGRVFVNAWAVEYFCSTVGVLNSLETNKRAPHIDLMEVLQALDTQKIFRSRNHIQGKL